MVERYGFIVFIREFKKIIMSSKTQLNDYVKRLKSEIRELKRDTEIYKKENQRLFFKANYLKDELRQSRLRERKWYHFF